MTDPFRKISPFDMEPTAFEPEDPDFVPPEQPPDFIRVPCRKCPEMCVRSDVSGKWVHEESLTRFSTLSNVAKGIAIHEADPNIIDVQEVSEHAEPSGEPGKGSGTQRAFGRIDP